MEIKLYLSIEPNASGTKDILMFFQKYLKDLVSHGYKFSLAKISKADLLNTMKRAELKSVGVNELPTMIVEQRYIVGASSIIQELTTILRNHAPQSPAAAARSQMADMRSQLSLEEQQERGLISMEEYQYEKGRLAAAAERNEDETKTQIQQKYIDYFSRHYGDKAQQPAQQQQAPRLLMADAAATPAPAATDQFAGLPMTPQVRFPTFDMGQPASQQQSHPSVVDMPPTLSIPNLVPRALQAQSQGALPTLVKPATPEMAAALAQPIANPSIEAMDRLSRSVMGNANPHMQSGGFDLTDDYVLNDALANLHKL